jgi:hypothetical protein
MHPRQKQLLEAIDTTLGVMAEQNLSTNTGRGHLRNAILTCSDVCKDGTPTQDFFVDLNGAFQDRSLKTDEIRDRLTRCRQRIADFVHQPSPQAQQPQRQGRPTNDEIKDALRVLRSAGYRTIRYS